jgi:hypothetical protein
MLPEFKTANALRSALKNGPEDKVAKTGTDIEKAALKAKGEAGDILNPAENYGGLMSFRYVAPIAIVLVVVFGAMYLVDKKKGGYKAEKIVKEGLA